jgi:hypothetical protein
MLDTVMNGPDFAAESVDITPRIGPPLGGYARREGRPSTGRHDSLMAEILWLRGSSGTDVVWVTLDAAAVDAELSGAIAGAVAGGVGCDPLSIIVCASHTHSGPAGWTGEIHPAARTGADPALRSELIERIGPAASELADRLQPVEVLYFETAAPGVGSNRNAPHGPHDDSVGVLAFVDDAGRIAGALFDHASHPTVLGEDNLEWSADWPGAAKRVLGAALAAGPPFSDAESPSLVRDSLRMQRNIAKDRGGPVVGFLQGAAGDISARFVRRDQTFAEANRLGALCAAHALRALSGTDPVSLSGAAPIVRRATVRLPVRSLPDPATAAKTVDEMDARWNEVRASNRPAPEQRIALTRLQGAEIAAKMASAELPPELELRITAVGIGSCAWIHLPVELFASLGLEIKKRSPFEYTRVVGYTDDYLGYVADERAHEDLVYEAMASVFDVRAGWDLVDAAVDLLELTKKSIP